MSSYGFSQANKVNRTRTTSSNVANQNRGDANTIVGKNRIRNITRTQTRNQVTDQGAVSGGVKLATQSNKALASIAGSLVKSNESSLDRAINAVSQANTGQPVFSDNREMQKNVVIGISVIAGTLLLVTALKR